MEQRGDAAELQASLVARVFWATELGPTVLGDAVAAVGEGKRSKGSPPSRSQRPPAYLGAGSPCGPGKKSVGFHRLSTEAAGNRKFFPGRLGLGPESACRWGQDGSQGDGGPCESQGCSPALTPGKAAGSCQSPGPHQVRFCAPLVSGGPNQIGGRG